MAEEIKPQASRNPRGSSRMPSNSLLFEKIVPILLGALGLVMVGLVLFAAGVLLGLVKF